MKKYKYMFTVFTASYNRAHLLNNVFTSLTSQTYRDFEWLIVDDGSNDNTKQVVESFKNRAHFPINYIYQSNSGKPAAFNRGVKQAGGRLFLTLDSDDTCLPSALERLHFYWKSIPARERNTYSAVTVLCMDEKGNVVGTEFPKHTIDSNSIEIRTKYKVKGEKWGFQRTDILKKYPYPIFKGEKWIPMSTVWYKIALKYKTRYVNESLRVYTLSDDSITVSNTRVKNPNGTAFYYNETLAMPFSLTNKIINAINYVRYNFHARQSIPFMIKNCKIPLLAIIALLPGYLLFSRDAKH
ncbi:MAG: glycosyltransferase family 2 protein [Spirochaetales bacterium]|nr:glycosyltransferase family 2 protein [Spirochaetales bacterium]